MTPMELANSLTIASDYLRSKGLPGLADDVRTAIDLLTPTAEPEPTIEECIAAMNRNQHGRHGNWFVRCSDKNRTCSFDEVEIRALGAYHIAREKAAEAKGGG